MSLLPCVCPHQLSRRCAHEQPWHCSRQQVGWEQQLCWGLLRRWGERFLPFTHVVALGTVVTVRGLRENGPSNLGPWLLGVKLGQVGWPLSMLDVFRAELGSWQWRPPAAASCREGDPGENSRGGDTEGTKVPGPQMGAGKDGSLTLPLCHTNFAAQCAQSFLCPALVILGEAEYLYLHSIMPGELPDCR